ncbi:MBL fold metallo-hydrolase [Streptomyces stelliscabiei]|uniref:MBL fold metallo-hydrolase n=1 Tax=Streptomyces stelliscabiei TaxID=146820 RepID=UPI002FEED5C9
MTASFHVLTTGYADTRVAGTVTLLVDGATVAVVDPGMVADRRLILDPLTDHGLTPEDVTDVVFSHHHPDHTLNAALFPRPASTTTWPSTATTSGRTGTPTATGSPRRSR